VRKSEAANNIVCPLTRKSEGHEPTLPPCFRRTELWGTWTTWFLPGWCLL